MREQLPSTVIRNLRQLARHLEDNDFSTQAQDRALRQAIKWLSAFRKAAGKPVAVKR